MLIIISPSRRRRSLAKKLAMSINWEAARLKFMAGLIAFAVLFLAVHIGIGIGRGIF